MMVIGHSHKLCVTYGTAYAPTSNIHILFIWAPKRMKQRVEGVFFNYQHVYTDYMSKAPFVQTRSYPELKIVLIGHSTLPTVSRT